MDAKYFNELMQMTPEQIHSEYEKAQAKMNDDYWLFTRRSNADVSIMANSTVKFTEMKLIKHYHKYFNNPVKLVDANGCGCLFSHKLDSFEKFITLDRLVFKNKGSKIILL